MQRNLYFVKFRSSPTFDKNFVNYKQATITKNNNKVFI